MTVRSLGSARAPVEFGELVRRAVLVEKRQPASCVAAALGLTQGSFYHRLQGRARFSPEQVAVLLREVDDDRLVVWLFGGSGIMAVKQPRPEEPAPEGSRFQRLAAAADATINVLQRLVADVDPGLSLETDGPPTEEMIDRGLAAVLAVKLDLVGHKPPFQPVPGSGSAGSFGSLVAQVLLTERRLRLQDLADSLGLGYHALRQRVVGGTPFSPADLRILFRLYPEPRLADYLLRETQYVAVPLPAVVDANDHYSPIQAGLLSLHDFVGLLGEIWRTAADHAASEPPDITCEIDEVLRHLVTLRWCTSHIGSQSAARPPRACKLPGVAAFAQSG